MDQISWRQAAVAGIGGGIAAGLTSLAAGANSTIGSAFDAIGTSSVTWSQTALAYGVQGVAGYAGNYIASKAVGLDTSFSWKNMAATAIGSSIAGSLNGNAGWAGSIIRGEVSTLSSAWMQDKWFGGDRPDYGQVAADAFGNALADFLVRSLQKNSGLEVKRDSDEWIYNNREEIEARASDPNYWVASNADAAIGIDPTIIVAEAPEGMFEQAMSYMQKARIAEQAYRSLRSSFCVRAPSARCALWGDCHSEPWDANYYCQQVDEQVLPR